jgi:hypothetical protein
MGYVALVNPKGKGRKKRPVKSNPRPASRRKQRRTGRRRARRNPIGFGRLRGAGRGLLGGVTSQVMGAGVGAVGAVALDFALRFAPVSVKTGAMSHITKAAAAIAVGLAAKRMPLVAQAAQGALTITLYQALRQYVTVPMGLGEITEGDMQQLADSYGDGSDGMGVYDVQALGVNTPALGVYDGQMSDAYDMQP